MSDTITKWEDLDIEKGSPHRSNKITFNGATLGWFTKYPMKLTSSHIKAIGNDHEIRILLERLWFNYDERRKRQIEANRIIEKAKRADEIREARRIARSLLGIPTIDEPTMNFDNIRELREKGKDIDRRLAKIRTK